MIGQEKRNNEEMVEWMNKRMNAIDLWAGKKFRY
jgi:hypothetical protein